MSDTDWDGFHLDTGALCLNFTATVADRAHAAFDRLRGPSDLAQWIVEAGILSARPAVSARQLDEARLLREAIYRSVQAVRNQSKPNKDDVAAANLWAARPDPMPVLDANSGAIDRVSDHPVEAALSAVARDALELLAKPRLDRLRECAKSDCSVLFIDQSRPGKRRWCSMSRCGNRSKKQTFRSRAGQ